MLLLYRLLALLALALLALALPPTTLLTYSFYPPAPLLPFLLR
jgi:hypothetical protein